MQITDRFWNQYKNSLQFLDKLMGQKNEIIENKVKRGKLKEEYSRISVSNVIHSTKLGQTGAL